MKKIFLVTILLLTACKGATTAAPRGSRDEVLQEQTTQQKLASEAAIKRAQTAVKATDAMRVQLKKVAATIAPAGAALCHDIGRSNCDFGFKLEESGDLNAYADGNYIVVSTAMMDFSTENELAVVLSHEYAHNVMGHVSTQTQNAAVGGILGTIADQLASSQGIPTGGAISQFAGGYATRRYSVGFEQEADYVGLYIMDRAGYEIGSAPNFWRKMSAADSAGITMRSTHPTNPERYVALSKTISEINAKKAAKQPLVPGFRNKN